MGIIMHENISYSGFGSEAARNVSYDNTTSGMLANNVQNAIDEANNFHKMTILLVDLTNWVQDTTSQIGTTLYKKQISINNVYTHSLIIDIGVGIEGTLPTIAEQESYDLLQYAIAEDTSPCYIELYAKDVPTTAFYINITGVD